MTSAKLFPRRIQVIGDAVAGLDDGLRNGAGLLRAAAPLAPYVVLMTALDFALAVHYPAYYRASSGQLDWWFSSVVFLPFGTAMAFGMLNWLWFRTQIRIEQLFAAVPTSLYCLGVVWLAMNWVSACITLAAKERVMLSSRGQYDHPSLFPDISAVNAFDTLLVNAIAAAMVGLIAAAALTARPFNDTKRSAMLVLCGLVVGGLMSAFVLRYGQFLLPEQLTLPAGLELAINAGTSVATALLLIAILQGGWFHTQVARIIGHAGWRLAALLLVGSALANASSYLFDAAGNWAGLTNLRIDDPYLRAEFIWRAFFHYGYYALRDFAFYVVLLSITAQGYRRVLGSELARFRPTHLSPALE